MIELVGVPNENRRIQKAAGVAIKCPFCKTSFNLLDAEDRNGPAGLEVKCGKCLAWQTGPIVKGSQRKMIC